MLHHQLNFELSFFHTFVYINFVLKLNLYAFIWSSPPAHQQRVFSNIHSIYILTIHFSTEYQEETKIGELIDSWVGAQDWFLRVDAHASDETS